MTHELQVFIAVAIFLVTYAVIISEKIHRMVIAMFGAALMLVLGVLNQEAAVLAIDFNTLGLLIGMMLIVSITRRTGVFEYLAVKAAKAVGGKPAGIMVMLCVITAIASALLDNVTTVLLIVPVTFSITRELDLNPVPFLIAEVLSSNIGGTATLIGDPPNIMIGSAVGLTFNDFLFNLAPVAVVIQAVILVILYFLFRGQFAVSPAAQKKILALNENEQIKDFLLLKQSLSILALTVAGFVLHGWLGLESATIALTGAMLLLIITKEEPEDVLLHVEWPTIFFFIGLFIVVGGLENVGVITWIAEKSLAVTGGNPGATVGLVLWLSAIASAFVDNIPFVATMIPLLKTMGQMTTLPMDTLWWSLALGACLGGNGTIIGASANVIVAGLAEKSGYPLSFRGFMKIGFPLMLLSVLLAHGYIWLRYL
ncbi:MAG: ArsB/NhaD family transporter [Heliobacteriaceae bacterium]|nr:ArsB/NhaD family transporter [Heliobacteriaceae bacterium]MDD4587795.1 ArsB/NhaD family transporter [Heliobacteriaceae bacterium]